jgi:hypothetical protein
MNLGLVRITFRAGDPERNVSISDDAAKLPLPLGNQAAQYCSISRQASVMFVSGKTYYWLLTITVHDIESYRERDTDKDRKSGGLLLGFLSSLHSS